MRVLSDAFQARLKEPATTLASAWRLTRRDGTVFGFTDHDEDLQFAGTLFRARTGWTSGESETARGLGAGTEAVEGGFADEAIREEEVERGLFDGASVETFRVDWQEPAHHVLMDSADLGEVTRGPAGFRAELRGLAAQLDRQRGRTYRRRCDAVLGDRRCGVDLGPWTRLVDLVAGSAERLVIRPVEPIARADQGLFAQGRLLLGASGEVVPLRGLTEGAEAGTLLAFLARTPAQVPAAGSRVRLIAGCDRAFATCRDRFGNSVNFRGFPHLPGADAALNIAKSDGLHDGSPVVP
ncbi:hypothetical protein NS365_13005 [Aureimonas ureilytica]|uniref:Bacteriophage phiJL001 Gp84 C-terminal domain-containing protein n=1 Tax=Aureimonas ureilytica TaxID=401562 RepID=A0A175RMC2_9HYPH|nr:DUF2163 domain-containing protein [Aureimonas ureilytica]KTR04955.1 hypothetical protein NS365_13005 [Aureimonas ureilytica]